MPIPSTEELDLRSQLDVAVEHLQASLTRCPIIDETLTEEGLIEADAAIDAVGAEIQRALAIAATLERLVGVTGEALMLANVARYSLEVARNAASLLRAELDCRTVA